MAELLPTNRFVLAHGPCKEEIINLSGTITDSDGNTQTGADDADTVKTLIQNPLFATGSITSDGVSDVLSFNVAISGKTLTLNHGGLAADNVVIRVIGF
jgi:hypothetical protein